MITTNWYKIREYYSISIYRTQFAYFFVSLDILDCTSSISTFYVRIQIW